MKADTGIGWYVTIAALVIVAFLGIGYFTDQEALGVAARFIWNGLVLIANGLARLLGGLLGLLARGVGWRRLSRIATAIAGIGLGYAGSVVLSDRSLEKARGWRQRGKAAFAVVQRRWQRLGLFWKLAIVAGLIWSQIYLHTLLILFPIAFLVPVVRRLWVQAADLLFGSWYWRTFGGWHRRAVATLRTLPVVRHAIGWARLTRMRYLCAWRLWRYHPRYRDAETNQRRVSFIEPLRLWWRGELDTYVGRPLLSGGRLVTESPRPDAKTRTTLPITRA
jgi:hypothetical protein